jgi:hypothetical protein
MINEMNITRANGLKQVESGIKNGEYLGVALGLFLFGFSIYAFSLSIKANKLAIKKFKDEGYQ